MNSAHELYWVWASMWKRCTNPNFKYYSNYGGRGITIDPMWAHFWTFVFDMGKRPDGYMLERKDNDGPYAPWNCTWASRKEQNRNSRSNVLITYKGITKCCGEWAEYFGLHRSTISLRVRTRGAAHALDGLSLRESP